MLPLALLVTVSIFVSAVGSQQSRCPALYSSIPDIDPPKINHSSTISKVFRSLHDIGAKFDGSCHRWPCQSQRYEGGQCKWCLPRVMVAGFSKCGTTAFCNKLSGHPEIKKYRKKEVNIFTKLGAFSWDTLETRAEDLHPNESGQVWMDCSSGAFRDLQVATHLRKYSPHTKVIFMVRDPWQRIGSYIEMIKRNAESEEDFNTLLARLKDKIRRHGSQPDTVRLSAHGIRHLAEVNNFMFIENLWVWMSVLDQENLLVLDHFDLEHRPLETMRRAEQFLGLEPHNYSSKLLYSVSANTVSVSPENSSSLTSSTVSLPTALSQVPTKSIHPPYAITDKRLVQLTKRLFIPSLCLFQAVFGWSIRIVTLEVLRSLPEVLRPQPPPPEELSSPGPLEEA
jgi:hypothetical protein